MKRRLFALHEWEIYVTLGRVHEPEYDPTRPSTGIACPGYMDIGDGICGAHLWDRPHSAFEDLYGRRKVFCSVCSFRGTRALASVSGTVFAGSG